VNYEVNSELLFVAGCWIGAIAVIGCASEHLHEDGFRLAWLVLLLFGVPLDVAGCLAHVYGPL
jgi:hypothetical protein